MGYPFTHGRKKAFQALQAWAIIPNADIIQTKDIEEKIVQIKAEIVGIAGSYVENRQRRFGQFLPIDWA